MSALRIEVPDRLFAPAECETFTGTFDLPEFDANPDTYRFARPLDWSVTVSNTGDALVVDGHVKGVGTTACARCLDDFDLDIDGHVEGYFLLPEAEEPEDRDEDDYERLSEDHVIDLTPLLQAAILVDVPLVPLCREDCKGLCPDCGANLNRETCDCAEKRAQERASFEDAANPFSVLKGIDFGDSGEGAPSDSKEA